MANENIVDADSFVFAKLKLTTVMITLLQIQEIGGGQAEKARKAFRDIVTAMEILGMDLNDQPIMSH
jgi:hypothetical protein